MERATRRDVAGWRRHPVSRWYICPIADRFAAALASGPVRPDHLTLCGLGCAATAVACLVLMPTSPAVAGPLVLLAWFFDRADGPLARRQHAASPRGAWLDAHVDELVDFGLHAAMAFAASQVTGSSWPWYLLIGFFAGKYLLMQGISLETAVTPGPRGSSLDATGGDAPAGWLRRLYHLPGNADVRIHLAVAALLTGGILVELAFVAFYYNFRWIARYPLVARRLGGAS